MDNPSLRSPLPDTLLLEGGSLRCAFTAGVLDAFAAVGLRDFERIYAVSAGAMAATSFLSGQRKHFIDVATSVIEDGQFIRFSSALSEEGIMNLAHLFDHVRRHHPLDFDGAKEAARGREVRFVTTDAESGEPLYLDPVEGNWLRILWASATLPMVTRGRIRVNGRWMFDGGISDALPLQAALDAGAQKIIVVRTRPSGQHVQQSWMDFFATYWSSETRPMRLLYEWTPYNDAVDRASGGEDGLDILEIAPDSLKSDGYRVQESLWADYHHGLAKGLDVVAALRTIPAHTRVSGYICAHSQPNPCATSSSWRSPPCPPICSPPSATSCSSPSTSRMVQQQSPGDLQPDGQCHRHDRLPSGALLQRSHGRPTTRRPT